LRTLHSINWVHGDIKPQNILVNNQKQIKLIDFGLAQNICDQNAASKKWTGTLPYAAPEIMKEEGSKTASDIWSVGMLLVHSVRQ
jgi:serine/threonine protein kinase